MATEGGNLNRLASALALTLILTIAPFLFGGSATSEPEGTPTERPVAAVAPITSSGWGEEVVEALCETVFGDDEYGSEPPEECTTQYDGRSHGDAADHCSAAAKVLPVDEASSTPFTGLLVPREDKHDHYIVGESADKGDISITLTAQPGLRAAGLLDPSDLPPMPRFAVTIYPKAADYGCAEAVAFGEQVDGHVHVTFMAEPGTVYVVGVERREDDWPSPQSPLHGSAKSLGGTSMVEGMEACHDFCIGNANDKFGYEMHADSQ